MAAIGCSKGSAPLSMDTWPSWIRRWPPKPQIAGSNPAVSAIIPFVQRLSLLHGVRIPLFALYRACYSAA